MADTLTGVKSIFKSKTAITGLLMSLFGILNMLGILPASFEASTLVNSLVTAGGILVAIFRNFATTKTALAPASA